MNTEGMIEVMQAHARGEIIQLCDIHGDKESSDDWEDIKDPSWNWGYFNYRVKPKNRKFGEGDKVIEKDAQMLMLDENNGYIWTVKGYTEDGGIEFKGGAIIPEHQVCEEYVKVDDALWYWEFKMSDGWHISQTRMTRSEARALVGESVDIAPLYALGFRVKDTK
nr:MAG TPA: hypothetical protein [Bacteriophage sp.]